MNAITTSTAAAQLGWPERTIRHVCLTDPPLGELLTPRLRVLSPSDVRELKRRLGKLRPIHGRRKSNASNV